MNPASVILQGLTADELRQSITDEILRELRPLLATPPKASRVDEFATRHELAAILRVSESTVGRMVHEGCPSLMRGQSRLFVVNEVVEWLRKQTPAAEAKAAEHQKTKHAVKRQASQR